MKTMNDTRKHMNATLKTQYVASKNGQLTDYLKIKNWQERILQKIPGPGIVTVEEMCYFVICHIDLSIQFIQKKRRY
jgi:hypothetical protein